MFNSSRCAVLLLLLFFMLHYCLYSQRKPYQNCNKLSKPNRSACIFIALPVLKYKRNMQNKCCSGDFFEAQTRWRTHTYDLCTINAT